MNKRIFTAEERELLNKNEYIVCFSERSIASAIACHVSEHASDREELERHLREYYREKEYRVSE